MTSKGKQYSEIIIKDWKEKGLYGVFESRVPWIRHHILIFEKISHMFGADPEDLVLPASLTLSLHLIMVKIFNPKPNKFLLFEYYYLDKR